MTQHFQDMIQFRSLNIEHVKQALNDPDEKDDVFDGKIRVKKDVGEKIIEVIYSKDNFRDKKEEYIIITAYYI
ncbi:MAG: hypothetical protein HW401_453 [Parcubacteria group bacterium]|nr:hypothetical protein [Parcubacteria group bacterium]